MTKQKFASGAFVFTRARGLQPRDPDELKPLAARHGLDESIVPAYAGDRAAIGRAIQQTSAGLYREGFMLRPIRRSSSQVAYAIVSEKKIEASQHLEHDHEATLRWSAESDSSAVQGDHPIAIRVADTYRKLRDKIVTEDWTSSIGSFLESHAATAVRGDGRIYWVPPQRLDDVRRLQGFLEEVGIDLVLCEIEPETKGVVQSVVHESLEEQLDRLQAEVVEFDGTQKPSTYTRRLEEYQRLRERAVLYRDALGVGVEKTEKVLAQLERKVGTMLDLRKKSVVHRDGTVDEEAGETPAEETGKEPGERPDARREAPPAGPATLRFAGADFTQAASDEPGVLKFVSDEESAKSSALALENMGLTGWQKVGPAEVSIRNSGPPGETVQIRLRIPAGQDIQSVARPLSSIGIELAN